MTAKPSGTLNGDLRTLFDEGAIGGATDPMLISRYEATRDEAAFAALVARHGNAVWRVCRAILGDAPEAEDAFQATFLVLARRAAAIRSPDRLAPWLAGVARRVSKKARTRALRRRKRELAAAIEERSTSAPVDFEQADTIREEVGRLPEKYRAPVALCYLDGLTHEEAAASLSWPVGTIRGRLSRARDLLRSRLTRRGLAPVAAVATAISSADAEVPRRLIESTIRPASPEAVTLAEEVLRAMTLFKFQVAAALGVAAVGTAAAFALAQKPGPAKLAPMPAEAHAPAKPSPSYQMVGSVKVEGTGEPVAGAVLDVRIGDSGPELPSARSARTDISRSICHPARRRRGCYGPPWDTRRRAT